MTDVTDVTVSATPGREQPGPTAPLAPWRPYAEDPLLTPAMALGWEATAPEDRRRLSRYLSALVAARRTPVHVSVAFNAAYFGYDLIAGGYVGGPLDLFAFPQVRFGETTDALPVGAMVNISAGAEPLFAEVVYKEGAHPALSSDGSLPAWLSGAPTGANGPGETADAAPGGPVLTERLVVDVDAFGQGLSTTHARLDRLRRRGRWLDADGHLLLEARYASRRDADLDETAFYAQYLLARGREQLLSAAAPLPLSTVLSDEASEDQLMAALTGMLHTITTAFTELPEVRVWRGYAFTRASLAARLRDTGPLGGDDLGSLAAQLRMSAVPRGRGHETPARAVTYTAVGPRLRDIRDAAPQLVGVGYALAVCHANAVLSDFARREADETTGLLPGGVHLRLDDPWQGGGVWRAEHPDSAYAHVEVTEPLGLGWLSAPVVPDPGADPGSPPEPEPAPDDEDTQQLTVTDSQVSWTQPLRLTHLLDGRLPLPDMITPQMRDAGLPGVRLRLMLTHDGYELDPAEAAQAVAANLFDRPQLTGIQWPLEFFAGIQLVCTWPRGAGVVRATTILLDCPVTIDGLDIEHRYDPRILTRDAAPGQARRGATGAGTLTFAQRILRAVRRLGRLDPEGRAVLARTHLLAAVYGTPDASAAELDPVIDQLIDSGELRAHVGSVDASEQPHFPARPGDSKVELVIYEPRPVVGPPRVATPRRGGAPRLDVRFVRAHAVAGHLRWLGDVGKTASEEQRQAYREDRARFRLLGPAELPDGYTYVRPFSRNRRS